MRIIDWSSDVCSSDLRNPARVEHERHVLDADVGDQAMRAALGIHVVEHRAAAVHGPVAHVEVAVADRGHAFDDAESPVHAGLADLVAEDVQLVAAVEVGGDDLAGRQRLLARADQRSEEHTSELQSLMRISYAVFCLKKKKKRYIV